jgi:hypothetical protein
MEPELKLTSNFTPELKFEFMAPPPCQARKQNKKNQKMEVKQKNTRGMEEKNKQWYEAHTWLSRTVSRNLELSTPPPPHSFTSP